MRISVDILEEVDRCATEAQISRNEFLVQAIQFALSNMEEPTKQDTD